MREPFGPSELLLIPSPLGPSWEGDTLTSHALARVRPLRHFAVEEPRQARRFLARIGMSRPIAELELYPFDKHSRREDAARLLDEIPSGEPLGVLSGAGLPGVADPGALLVEQAHARGITVTPLCGPSSLMLTLMASGLNGQQFAFAGYLPIPTAARTRAIAQLERRARTEGQTQILIETPYRNDALLTLLLTHLAPNTRLCIGYALQHPDAWVRTMPVHLWRSRRPILGKKPAVFAIL